MEACIAAASPVSVGARIRVALVVPSQVSVYGPFDPPTQLHLGLAYVAAAVEDLCAVTVLDLDADRLSPSDFAIRLCSEAYDIVGFSVATPVFPQALELAAIVRRELPGAWTVFGGYHPSLMPEEVMANRCVDFAVVGEGEEAFRALVAARADSRVDAVIPGVVGRTAQGELHFEPAARNERGRLDRLRFPARQFFSSSYSYPDALYRKVAPIITSRGCAGHCSYCNAPQLYGRRCSFRSPTSIADEIEGLVGQGYREIHIWDDNFIASRQQLFSLRDELHQRRLSVPIALPGGVRADGVTREVVAALRDMGVYSVAVGVESGSQAILDAAGKGVTMTNIRQAFDLLRGSGIETWAFFLFGLPGESPRTLRQTIDFAIELNPDVAKFHIVKPYPGTRLRAELQAGGWLLDSGYAALGIHLPPVHQLPELSPSELLAWQKRAYREFYFASPHRLWRQLRRIRSWHRFKVNLAGGLGLLRLLRGRQPLPLSDRRATQRPEGRG